MKKMLLSLFALLVVSLASAQSYAKQPDPATYQVVEYKPSKTAPAEATEAAPQKAAENETAPQEQDAEKNNNSAAPAPQPATVAEKDMQNRKRK